MQSFVNNMVEIWEKNSLQICHVLNSFHVIDNDNKIEHEDLMVIKIKHKNKLN